MIRQINCHLDGQTVQVRADGETVLEFKYPTSDEANIKYAQMCRATGREDAAAVFVARQLVRKNESPEPYVAQYASALLWAYGFDDPDASVQWAELAEDIDKLIVKVHLQPDISPDENCFTVASALNALTVPAEASLTSPDIRSECPYPTLQMVFNLKHLSLDSPDDATRLAKVLSVPDETDPAAEEADRKEGEHHVGD